jgi:hypothetical protein
LIQLFVTPTSICANNITKAAYLNQTLTLITYFQLNATYSPVFQLESPNFILYMKNSTNQALLYSNCTAFVIGVKNAKSADEAAECTRERISQYIDQRFQQVVYNVTGSKGPNDLDSSEHCHHC